MNIELINKLWEKTEVKDGHWLYKTTYKNTGYGYLIKNNKYFLVHRLSLQIYLGLDYKEKYITCHTCEYRNCWIPIHLYAGTYSSNVQDAIIKGTMRPGEFNRNKEFCIREHEFTPENTLITKAGYRICRKCHYLNGKLWEEKERQRIKGQRSC